MKIHTAFPLLASVLCQSASAIRIMCVNDDSWASANIRATFSALVGAGHDVVLVGCVRLSLVDVSSNV